MLCYVMLFHENMLCHAIPCYVFTFHTDPSIYRAMYEACPVELEVKGLSENMQLHIQLLIGISLMYAYSITL